MEEMPPLLPKRDKILYASGSLAGNVLFQATVLWLLFFYAPPDDELDATRYIGIGVAGLLLGLGRLIESFDDPLVGYWSDSARSSLGRRLPFILIGAPLLAVAFVLVWTPPAGERSAWNAVYFFFILQLFFFLYTAVRGPYAALLPEIARTSAERVSISAWEVFFGSLGAVIAFVLTGFLIDHAGYKVMGLTLGAISVVFHWTAVLGARRHTRDPVVAPTMGLRDSLRATVGNRQFLGYGVAFGAFALGQGAVTAVVPYLVELLLAGEDLELRVGGLEASLGEGGATSIVLGVFIIVVIVSLPVLQAVARRTSKAFVFGLSMLATGLYLPFLVVVGVLPGLPDFPQVFLLSGLGVTMAGVFALPNALLADVIDYDELVTGERREAMYFGVQGTIQRIGLSLAAVMVGTSQGLLGNTAEDPWGVRVVGPLAGLVVLGGYLVFRAVYRLPDQVTRQSAAHLLGERPGGG